MFKLLRYYSITSFVALVFIAVILGIFYRSVAVDSLLELGESKNVALTRAFSNSLWPKFAPILTSASGLSTEDLPSPSVTAELRQAVLDQMVGLSIIKVKIYNLEGLTLFSTEASQIGEDKSTNEGFLSAASGNVASELTHRDTFSAFESTIENRDVISSYVPIQMGGNDDLVVGVFEVYDDVTPLLESIENTQRNVTIGISLLFTLLYTVLFFIVKRADIIIQNHQSGLMLREKELLEDQNSLEIRVQERTVDLMESEEKFKSYIENAPIGIFVSDEMGNVVDVNKAAQNIIGFSRNDLLNMTLIDIVGAEDHQRARKEFDKFNKSGGITTELSIINKDGVLNYWTVDAVKLSGNRFLGFVSDITERKLAEKQLHHLVTHDALTNLPNRDLLIDRLNHAIGLAKRNKTLVAVIFMDLDNFKRVNDAYGHDQGDWLLKEYTQRITSILREGDTVARISGDEFVIVLENIDSQEDIIPILEKLTQLISEPFTIDEVEVFITASMGISFYPSDGENSELLLQNADLAMYKAKKNNEETYQFFSSEIKAEMLDQIEVRRELRQAISRNELVLHYQPQIDVRSGSMIGVEALLRWQHPKRGFLLPREFILHLGSGGIGATIGEWVLETACSQLQSWIKRGFPAIRMAVNISGAELRRTDLVEVIKKLLDKTNLSPELLELEITENVVFQDLEAAIHLLEELKGLGVRIAVDDFGTGYSTLSQISRFPFDTLKIDRYFSQYVSSSSNDAAIVKGIVTIAKSLNLDIVAEGIENTEQLAFFKELDVQTIQGHYFHEAMAASNIEILLEKELE